MHIVRFFFVQLRFVEVAEGAVDQVPVPEPLPFGSERYEFVLSKGGDRFGHGLLFRVGPICMIVSPYALELVIVQAKCPLIAGKRSKLLFLLAGSQQARAGKRTA